MRNWFDVPIYITTRDRLSDLLALLAWLDLAGYRNVTLIDNQSTYPPLVELLMEGPYSVIPMWDNLGPRALWHLPEDHYRSDYFVVTDPDVVPTEDCPLDVVAHLARILDRHPGPGKLGLGLVPPPLTHSEVMWELELHNPSRWLGDCFASPVDTTFALYRPGEMAHCTSMRSGPPYEAYHLPWFREGHPLSAEDRYYLDRARPGPAGSTWAERAAVGTFRQ